MSWKTAQERGDGQLVQVTIFSFDDGKSTFSEPLDAAVDHLVFDELSGQAIHKWRVLTHHGKGWTPSVVATFTGPTCVADLHP